MQKTRWRVITGAPCSGKTSVIFRLEKMGYRVVREVARAYIDELLESGMTLSQIKAEPLTFEREILYRKLRIESTLPPEKLVFLDRAVPDSIAYFEAEGLPPDEPIEKSRITRYEQIFHFERLDFEKDRVRWEDNSQAARLDPLILNSYKMLGYKPVRVPKMSIDKRVRMLLDYL